MEFCECGGVVKLLLLFAVAAMVGYVWSELLWRQRCRKEQPVWVDDSWYCIEKAPKGILTRSRGAAQQGSDRPKVE